MSSNTVHWQLALSAINPDSLVNEEGKLETALYRKKGWARLSLGVRRRSTNYCSDLVLGYGLSDMNGGEISDDMYPLFELLDTTRYPVSVRVFYTAVGV